MISQTFYNSDRLTKQFFNKGLFHFPLKERIKVTVYEEYEVKVGEDLYQIAKDWFGENGEKYWTIISDINNYRNPFDLTVGEIIKLPVEIIAETPNRLPSYEQSSTTPTTV